MLLYSINIEKIENSKSIIPQGKVADNVKTEKAKILKV